MRNMYRKSIALMIFILGVSILIAVDNVVLVEIRNADIRTADLIEMINTIPEMHRTRFKSVDGQIQLLNDMVVLTTFNLAARDLGIDQLPEYQRAIDQGLRPIFIRLFEEENLAREGKFGTADVQDFYRENIANFTIPPRVSIQSLQTNAANVAIVQAALEEGVAFEELITEYSTNDATRINTGLIREIRLNGFFSGIGMDHELNRHVADASIDAETVYGPFTTSTGVHFFRKLTHIPAVVRPFEVVQEDILRGMRTRLQIEIFNREIARLRAKHNVRFYFDRIEGKSINNHSMSDLAIVVVESNHPNITLTFADCIPILRRAQAERANIDEPRVRENLITEEVNALTFFAETLDMGFKNKYKDNAEVKQLITNTLANFYYQMEIVEKIVITEENVREFYDNNISRFTIPTSRTIRQFVAKNDKEAKKHHKAMRNHLRKNDENRIITLIQKNSLRTENDGIISTIYQNNIMPGSGPDEVYNNHVWRLKIGELSPIFKNRSGDIVFFYVMNEEPERHRPISEVTNNIRNTLHNNLVRAQLETRKEELNIEYGVVFHFDRLQSLITPEELFTLAVEAKRRLSFGEAISLYDVVISDYPDTQHAYHALFMKAFISAEDLRDTRNAIIFFEQLLREFPDGDLNESAESMLEALRDNVPIESRVFEQ
jgi:hypothetical protein